MFRPLRLQSGEHVIAYLITNLCPEMESLLHHNANSDGSERTKPCFHDPISRMVPHLAAYRVVNKEGAYGGDRTFAIQRMLHGQHLRNRSVKNRSASFVEALFRWAFKNVFREATGAPDAVANQTCRSRSRGESRGKRPKAEIRSRRRVSIFIKYFVVFNPPFVSIIPPDTRTSISCYGSVMLCYIYFVFVG